MTVVGEDSISIGLVSQKSKRQQTDGSKVHRGKYL